MRTKLFVLVGLSVVVLTSVFFVSNVSAQQAIMTTDITSTMYVGNYWSISFTGLNAGEKVYVTGGKVFNGVVADTPVLMGTADASGNLNLCGMHYPNVVGDWQTNWTRANGTIIRSLNFSVLPVTPNGGTVDTYQYEDYTALAPTDRSPFPFPKDAIGAYPFTPLPYGVLSPDPVMQSWYIAVLTAAQKIDPNATISRKTGMATVTVNGRPILLTGMMKGTLITSDQISQVLASTPPPACGVSTRSMTAAEITQFMTSNPGYVNPYLMFRAGGVFGDSSTWSHQQHWWYDPTFQSDNGSGDYNFWSGAADAKREPFQDTLTYCSSGADINTCSRVDSKGKVYSPLPSSPYYISLPEDTLVKDALGFGEPYMAPDELAGKLRLKAYPIDYGCASVGGCAIGAYVRKAVHAYIIPKLPTYVPAPASLSVGFHNAAETKTYFDAVSARQAYIKAADKVVADAVQQIQLQMGSASNEKAAALAFINQWNKDPLPTITTTTPPPPTTGTITPPAGTGTTITQTQYVNNLVSTLNSIIARYQSMVANVPTTSGSPGTIGIAAPSFDSCPLVMSADGVISHVCSPANPPIGGNTGGITSVTFPAIITVTAGTLNVRSAPTTSAPLSGSQTLHAGDQFVAVEYTTGDNVEGENIWWKSSLGNYVWSGGTIQKSSVN